MKKRRNITAKLCLLLLFFAVLAMIVLPFQVWATDGDYDNDGILDIEEGQCLPLGAQNCAFTNPDIPDLFVLLQKVEPSLLPDDPFEFINNEFNIFHINLHEISPADTTGQVISTAGPQYAVLLIEDQRTSDGDLGTSQIGTPFLKVSGRVYPNRIREDVINSIPRGYNCTCVVNSAGAPCKNPDGSTVQGIDQIVAFYERNVLAHETFHMLYRVIPSDSTFGNHYAQIGAIMDHHMAYKVTKKSKTVTWTITDKWTDGDKPLFR